MSSAIPLLPLWALGGLLYGDLIYRQRYVPNFQLDHLSVSSELWLTDGCKSITSSIFQLNAHNIVNPYSLYQLPTVIIFYLFGDYDNPCID
jgi:hypothetical protein